MLDMTAAGDGAFMGELEASRLGNLVSFERPPQDAHDWCLDRCTGVLGTRMRLGVTWRITANSAEVALRVVCSLGS